jgi:hypothetical protein
MLHDSVSRGRPGGLSYPRSRQPNHEMSGLHGQGDYLQETDQENRAVVNGDGHGEEA